MASTKVCLSLEKLLLACEQVGNLRASRLIHAPISSSAQEPQAECKLHIYTRHAVQLATTIRLVHIDITAISMLQVQIAC